MMTIYLRYASRDAARVSLASVLGWGADEDGNLPSMGYLGSTRYDVDEVGLLDTSPREDAPEDAEAEPHSGWHVNVLWWGDEVGAPDFGAADLAPDPETPSRVFAI